MPYRLATAQYLICLHTTKSIIHTRVLNCKILFSHILTLNLAWRYQVYYTVYRSGVVAQLGERLLDVQEVCGSSPHGPIDRLEETPSGVSFFLPSDRLFNRGLFYRCPFCRSFCRRCDLLNRSSSRSAYSRKLKNLLNISYRYDLQSILYF